jgi:hypothetical protein
MDLAGPLFKSLSGPKGCVCTIWFSAPRALGKAPGWRSLSNSFLYPPSLEFHGKQNREDKNKVAEPLLELLRDFRISDLGFCTWPPPNLVLLGGLTTCIFLSLSFPIVKGGVRKPCPVFKDM